MLAAAGAIGGGRAREVLPEDVAAPPPDRSAWNHPPTRQLTKSHRRSDPGPRDTTHVRQKVPGLVRSKSSFRIRAKHEKEDASVQQLRNTMSNSLINTAILSVFLCALGDAIYVSPPLDPKCRGETGVQMVYIIEWCSMGCFFLVIVLTFILLTDMDGLPDDFLVNHLQDNIVLYSVHHPLMHVAIMLLAVGYGMDLDERVGCPLFPFGTVAAPCFPLLTFGIMKYAQLRRRQSGARAGDEGRTLRLGRSVFSTWSDLLQRVEKVEPRPHSPQTP